MTIEARIEAAVARMEALAKHLEEVYGMQQGAEVMTVAEISKFLRISPRTVQGYFKEGLLTNAGSPTRMKALRAQVHELSRRGVDRSRQDMRWRSLARRRVVA